MTTLYHNDAVLVIDKRLSLYMKMGVYVGRSDMEQRDIDVHFPRKNMTLSMQRYQVVKNFDPLSAHIEWG